VYICVYLLWIYMYVLVGMNVCRCVCIYMCPFMYVILYVNFCMYVYICMYMFMCLCTLVCVHVCRCVCMCTHVRFNYTYVYVCVFVCVYIYIYTGCPRRKGPKIGRVFLRSNYNDITKKTYIQSSMVTEVSAREVWNFDSYYSLIDYQIHIETGRNMWFL